MNFTETSNISLWLSTAHYAELKDMIMDITNLHGVNYTQMSKFA